MIRNRDYLTELFRKLSRGTLTEAERAELAMAIELCPEEELHRLMVIVEEEAGDRPGPSPEEIWPFIASLPEGIAQPRKTRK